MDWTEKYRPTTLDDIKGQEHVINRMKNQIKEIHAGTDGDFPNLFFSGGAGTGKNCAIYAFLKDCFGDEWDSNLTELNASDDRKIDTIRTKVKSAACKSVLSTYMTPDGREKDIPFNIIFMDEVDALTPEAQAALRRIIEEYSHITRFVFSCNYDWKIIDPIKSRCMCFKFRRIHPSAMFEVLAPILVKEKVLINPDAVDRLCVVAKGDARKAINMLHSAKLTGELTTVEIIDEISCNFKSSIKFNVINNFIVSNDMNPSPSNNEGKSVKNKFFNELWSHLEGLYWKGMDAREIIHAIVEVLTERYESPELNRKIISGAGEALYRCSLDNSIIHIVNWLQKVK
jgi:replication factor C small subunit